MYKTKYIVILTFVLIFELCLGLEVEKQRRYNSNTDFLLHEAGGNPTAHKTQLTGSTQSTLSSSGKRDYVAPSTSPRPSSRQTPPQPTTTKAGTPPKRDYVSPQFPTLKPPQTSQHSGNVKDLVSFFDSKSNNGNGTPKPPSYSAILQGSNDRNKPSSTVMTSSTTRFQQPVTQSTPKSPQTQTTRSYSSILSGSSKQTTPKSSTGPYVPSKPTFTPTARPSTPVLPSTLLNNNKNNNQGSSYNSVTDIEIQTLSEELLRKDTNNAAKYLTINYQEKTTSQSKEDKAPQPLLTVAPAAWNIPTIQKFVPLLDNYERDTLVNEYVTPQERNEENAFMDAIMSTTVIRHLMNFLKMKGYVTPDPRQQRDFLKQLWFGLYSRGKGKISSSGFEHIFLSENRNSEVLGLHNWIYFSKEESANRINYLGYLKYVPLSDKGAVIKLHFNQNGLDKPVDTMFIGTSPELEVSLYTLCFVTRADNDCKLKLGNKDVNILSHTFRYRSKNLIGSAYPQI